MAKKRGKQRPIRVGVVGVGRGRSFMQAAQATGMELVAICQQSTQRQQTNFREATNAPSSPGRPSH